MIRFRAGRPGLLVQRSLLVSGSLLLSVAGLGFAELLARRLGSPPDQLLVTFADTVAGYRRECGAAAALGRREAGVLRVAVIGESSGEMLAKPMERAAAISGAKLRVAACAQGGAGLAQVEHRFDEVAKADPDAVVVVFGHNLEYQYPEGAAVAALWLRAHSALAAALLAAAPPPPPVDLAARRVELERFLRDAARTARQQGFQLLLTTMTPNLWMPPDGDPQVEVGPQIAESRFLRAVGDVGGSERLLIPAADGPGAANAVFELALSRRLRGRFREAHGDLERLSELWPRARVSPATNALIRRVASEEHVLLRDTLADIESHTTDGTPGWESVPDNCHLRESLFSHEAQQVLHMLGVDVSAHAVEPIDDRSTLLDRLHAVFVSAMESGQPIGYYPVSHLDPALAIVYWRLVSEGGVAERQALEGVIAALDATPSPVSAGVRTRVLTAAAQAYSYLGELPEARRLNAHAREAGGRESARAWIQLGLFDLAEQRRETAAACFKRALELDPNRAEAGVYLQRLQALDAAGTIGIARTAGGYP